MIERLPPPHPPWASHHSHPTLPPPPPPPLRPLPPGSPPATPPPRRPLDPPPHPGAPPGPARGPAWQVPATRLRTWCRADDRPGDHTVKVDRRAARAASTSVPLGRHHRRPHPHRPPRPPRPRFASSPAPTGRPLFPLPPPRPATTSTRCCTRRLPLRYGRAYGYGREPASAPTSRPRWSPCHYRAHAQYRPTPTCRPCTPCRGSPPGTTTSPTTSPGREPPARRGRLPHAKAPHRLRRVDAGPVAAPRPGDGARVYRLSSALPTCMLDLRTYRKQAARPPRPRHPARTITGDPVRC